MLVSFSTKNPTHPDKPPVDRLLNSAHVVEVEPLEIGSPTQPLTGALITMSSKVKHRVDLSPKEVERVFQVRGAR